MNDQQSLEVRIIPELRGILEEAVKTLARVNRILDKVEAGDVCMVTKGPFGIEVTTTPRIRK